MACLYAFLLLEGEACRAASTGGHENRTINLKDKTFYRHALILTAARQASPSRRMARPAQGDFSPAEATGVAFSNTNVPENNLDILQGGPRPPGAV